jgi:hypothetical protein
MAESYLDQGLVTENVVDAHMAGMVHKKRRSDRRSLRIGTPYKRMKVGRLLDEGHGLIALDVGKRSRRK